MNHPRSIALAACCLLQFACLGGCVAIYQHHPVEVTVKNAETGQPIPGAEVRVSYPQVLHVNPPQPAFDYTNAHGTVTLPAATFPQYWQAAAQGYLPVRKAESTSDDLAKTKLTLRLYRQPAPRVRIILPNGYHGPLMIEFWPVQKWVQSGIGMRIFTFKASPLGYVGIAATPLLLDIPNYDIQALFADGHALPPIHSMDKPADIGLRWLEKRGDRLLYVVGTVQDEKALWPVIYDHLNGDPDNLHLNDKAFNALFIGAMTRRTLVTH